MFRRINVSIYRRYGRVFVFQVFSVVQIKKNRMFWKRAFYTFIEM